MPELCERCAREGPGCCRGTQILITGGDEARIRRSTGRADFFAVHDAHPEPCPDARRDLAWARAWAGRRRVLRHGPDGGCVFLGPAGCVLALDARPLVCRLYPYEYTPDCIAGVTASLCPEPERHNAPLLLALLGMNRDAAEGWRRRLYEELAADPP